MTWRGAALVLLAWLAVAQQTPTPTYIRVAVARVDAHAEASAASPVLGSVEYGVVLPVVGSDHGWAHVIVFVSGAKVEVFVPESATAPAPASPVNAPMHLPAGRIVGRGEPKKPSVALDAAGRTTWIDPVALRAVPVASSATTLAPLASSPGMTTAIEGGTVLPNDSAAAVDWTWLLPAPALKVSAPRTPVLSAFYSELPDVPIDRVIPVLVRLAPAGNVWRAVSAARGRADMPFHDDTDWDIANGLVEDRVTGQRPEGGAGLMKIRLDRPLTPGDYAVVLRFAGPRRVSGSTIFGGSALAAGDSIVFTIAWPFRVM
jgi:hypothetical protein